MLEFDNINVILTKLNNNDNFKENQDTIKELLTTLF